MYAYIKEIEVKDKKFRVELTKSDIKDIDNWDICLESAISEKALLRIAEMNSKKVFYNPYGFGKHLYDFDVSKDLDEFIKNNKNKKPKDCNDYFVVIYADIEIDELNNTFAQTSDNLKVIDRIVNLIIQNAII